VKTREPIFNFAEPVPVWFCAVLIAAHAVLVFAPVGLEADVREWALLAAIDGKVDLDRRGISNAWSLLLHGFLHGDWGHVLMNSGMIAVFGVLVCRAARPSKTFGGDSQGAWRGPARFFAIVIGSIIAGGLTQWGYWIATDATASAVGASGGASGLFAAAGWVLGGRKRLLQFGGAWILLNILLALGGQFGLLPSLIAWPAHLGGYVGGALLAIIMLRPSSTDFVITR